MKKLILLLIAMAFIVTGFCQAKPTNTEFKSTYNIYHYFDKLKNDPWTFDDYGGWVKYATAKKTRVLVDSLANSSNQLFKSKSDTVNMKGYFTQYDALGKVNYSDLSPFNTHISNDGDLNNTNELQSLSLGTKSGTVQPINISGGTGVNIDVADNDNDATNEIQVVGMTSGTNPAITISKNGGTWAFQSSGNITITGNSSTKIATIYVPTSLSSFTNDLGNYGGYLTGITGTMVTNALGYTPYNSSNPNGYTSNTGTVTSVGLTVPTGLSVSGSPVTTSGSIAISLASGYKIPTIAKLDQYDEAYSNLGKVGQLNTYNYGYLHYSDFTYDAGTSTYRLNLKTVNGNSLIGSADISITPTWGNISGTISTQADLINLFNTKQNALVSGTSIKTINGSSVLGSGDLTVSTPLASSTVIGGMKTGTAPAAGTIALSMYGDYGYIAMNKSAIEYVFTGNITTHTHSAYVPYTGATGNVNLGDYTITAYTFQLSDSTLKTSIKPLKRNVGNIKFYEYRMKADTAKKHYGVLAQEIEKDFPELIATDDKGIKSVNYPELLILKINYLEHQMYWLKLITGILIIMVATIITFRRNEK